ncbi:hypothetical protein MW887_000760 [Aspergillus wentii]|nr:hypothetical protein MW887_000760 [Aspergillus wentii]
MAFFECQFHSVCLWGTPSYGGVYVLEDSDSANGEQDLKPFISTEDKDDELTAISTGEKNIFLGSSSARPLLVDPSRDAACRERENGAGCSDEENAPVAQHTKRDGRHA